ncbi:MAG: hypothetical protein ACLR09_07185 [Gallintestinimicrobium sp.]
MILDGDQMVYKKEILAPEFTRSGYNAIWTDAETDEWLMQVENGIVRSCSRTGGRGRLAALQCVALERGGWKAAEKTPGA